MAGSRPEALRSYDIETRGVEAAEYHPSNGPLTNFAFGDMVTELGISGGKHDRIVTSKSECLGWGPSEIKRLERENIPQNPSWNLPCNEEVVEEGTGKGRLICKPSFTRVSQLETKDSKLHEWFRSKRTGKETELSKGWVGFHVVRPWYSTVEPYSTYWAEYKLPEEKVGSFAGSTLADGSGTIVTATDTDKGELTNEESSTVHTTGTEEKR